MTLNDLRKKHSDSITDVDKNHNDRLEFLLDNITKKPSEPETTDTQSSEELLKTEETQQKE